jgi:hypothetical protein
LKFISDPNNHSLVGNPTAGRLRRLIEVQMEKFNCDPKKNVYIETIPTGRVFKRVLRFIFI